MSSTPPHEEENLPAVPVAATPLKREIKTRFPVVSNSVTYNN